MTSCPIFYNSAADSKHAVSVLHWWIIYMRSWCNIFEKLDNLFSGKKFLVIININCSDHWIRPQLGTSSSKYNWRWFQITVSDEAVEIFYMLSKNYYYLQIFTTAVCLFCTLFVMVITGLTWAGDTERVVMGEGPFRWGITILALSSQVIRPARHTHNLA